MEPMETVYDLVIVGAGPAGLEAALQAQNAGLSYILFDQETAGSLIENTMANKKFLHVYGRNTATLKGVLPFPDRLKGGELVTLWKEAAKSLSFKPHAKIHTVKKSGDTFTVEADAETYAAKHVLLTSGTFEKHRTLDVPGEINNPKVLYTLDYYEEYAGKNVVVVGGGNSALETAIHLADHNAVTLVIRKPAFAESAAQNNLDAVTKLTEEKRLMTHFESTVEKISEMDVSLQTPSGGVAIPYDLLFIHAGFVQPSEFLVSLGIEVRDGKAVFNDSSFETRVPGLFIAGALTGADSVIESANQAYEIVRSLA